MCLVNLFTEKDVDKINFEQTENMLLQVFWDHLWSGTENSDRTRGNMHKQNMKFHPNTRRPIFPVRVLKCWDRLARKVLSPSVEML